MRYIEILNEDLGNLSVLGKLADITRQQIISGRKIEPRAGSLDKKFSHQTLWMNVGPNSPVVSAGILKTGFADIRDAYKKVSKETYGVGFAIFVNNTPICFALIEKENIRKSTMSFLMAYDLSPFKSIVEKYDEERNKDKYSYMKKTTDITTSSSEQPSKWASSQEIIEYRGRVFTATEVNDLLQVIIYIANDTNTQAEIRIVGQDLTSREKRQQRLTLKNSPQLKSLMDRLKMFKNEKYPTAETIHDFIQMIADNAAAKIRFEGNVYSKIKNSYDKLSPIELLNGKTFDIHYNSENPGSYYSDTLYITYKFDKTTNMLIPIEARWTNKETRQSRKEILNDKMWLTKFDGGDNPEQNKNKIIKHILYLISNNPNNPDIARIVNALNRSGYNWQELEVIKKSIKG